MKGFIITAAIIALTASVLTRMFDITGIFPFLDGFGWYRYEYADKYTAGEAEIGERVNTLDVDWITGSVNVEFHDKDTILIKERSNSNISGDMQLRWRINNGVLTVKYAKSGANMPIGMNKQLTITLPRDAQPENADIDTTTGTVTINGGRWKKIDADTTTGAVNITADSVDDLDADITSGDISVNTAVSGRIDLDCTTGEINITADEFADIDASSISGSVTVDIPEGCGFTADLSVTTGKVKCGHEHTENGSEYVAGDGSRRIDISTTTGNIEIK